MMDTAIGHADARGRRVGMATDPQTFQQFCTQHDLSTQTLATQIIRRHQDTIKVKKADVATRSLHRILDSALALSNKTGFHAMSLRDLSEHSEVSMGALYSYFDSKETLLAMILHTVAEAVENMLVRPLSTAEGSPAERLRWLLARHIHLTEAMRPWFFFVYMEAKAFTQDAKASARSHERRTEALIEDILREGHKSGAFELDDEVMTATLIKPLLQDWYVKRAKYRRRGVTPDQFAQSIIKFVESAILMSTAKSAMPALARRRRATR
jgi:TetR/AcrR family transcriptional regulator, cholesterol catabolism regulator